MTERRRNRPGVWDAAGLAGGAAAADGALGGLGAGVLSGLRSPAALARAALLGGGGLGALTGAGTLLGSTLMGAPGDDEGAAYAKRAGLGGGILGAGLGGAGGVAAAGALDPRSRLAALAKRTSIPTDNLVGDLFRSLARRPRLARALLGGGAGALLGGLSGGYLAGGEGATADVANEAL